MGVIKGILSFIVNGVKVIILKNSKTYKKGKAGEEIVADFLDAMGDGKLLNDVLVQKSINNGKVCYTQIDHIYITDYAIYVIETKNHSGVIYGGEQLKQWTVAYGDKKFKLYNPLWQNETHARIVRNIISDKGALVVPLVVFAHPRCRIETPLDGVCTFEQLINYYDKLISIRGKKIDKKKVYKEIKKVDVSHSNYHVIKQVEYAKSRQRENK